MAPICSARVPLIQASIEGPLSSLQDPWDWTVEQVVFALTDQQSLLRIHNAQLSLPDASALAKVLRENDVTGLALLTLLNTHSLRDELGIKSMGHRAAINQLIWQLQNISSKFQEQQFQEQAAHSARLSSVGLSSQIGSPYFATSRAVSTIQGSLFSPDNSSRQGQSGLGQNRVQPRDVLEEGPAITQVVRPNQGMLRSLEHTQDGESLRVDVNGDRSDQVRPGNSMNDPDARPPSLEERSLSEAKDGPDVEQAGSHCRQGETIVTDEQGKKRRRLVLAQSVTSQPADTISGNPQDLDEPPSSPETLRKDTDTNLSIETSFAETSDCQVFDGKRLLNTHRPHTPVQATMPIADSERGSADAVAEPGTVVVDENGRKRMTIRDVTHANDQQQRSFGKMAKRTADQTYLGFASMPIDTLIYGDVALGKDLDKLQKGGTTSQSEESDGVDDFCIVSNSDIGKGQRRYVNARMKYLLRAQRLSLKQDGRDHIGLIPYPDMICKKDCPLSITIFSSSSRGVTASRANRFKWITGYHTPDAIEADGRASGVFNVADPALARNETEDTEWRTLEKWNFMDGEDQVLPVYGESESEGEYDLDTWREMEKERGEIPRPLGRSQSAKLTSAEVQGAIDVAMEQIVRNWTFKRLPKLKAKEWRLWTQSRRNRNSHIQIKSFTLELEKLEARIDALRKEITQETWSKTMQVQKQCNIIQPSIFDREDYKWKVAILGLQKAPEKLPPVARQPKLAKRPKPREVPENSEEIITTDSENSDSSEGDLDDFIVEDDADGGTYQPMIADDRLEMADVEDGIDSNSIIVKKFEPKTPTKPAKILRQAGHSPSNVIDLTQHSDPVTPEIFSLKPERSYAIKTPPLYSSENDSDIFQRSRSTKPKFRLPPSIPKDSTKSTEIISLDSDSDNPVRSAYPDLCSQFPALSDVDAIRAMNADDLVERQDRKRLLIWTVAHTPAHARRAAFKYLNSTSIKASCANTMSGLTELRRKRYVKNMDNTDLDSVMRVATWCVCWTVPVKVTNQGLKTRDVTATLENEDGYESFYDFLLECLRHYQKSTSRPGGKKLKKKRELIVREDSDEDTLPDSQTRKRKYFVPESQETLDKRHAAQDRFRANEERRRREELKYRFTRMNTDNRDTSKVVVNPGKLADQDFIYLCPEFGNGAHIKPHQKEGLQFLWREITSEHEDLQGCLLAQTMGLGKTMQVLALLVTLSEAARSSNNNVRNQVPPDLRDSRTLILCPPALVENWWDECLLWPPQPLSDNIGELRKVTSAMKPADRHIEIHAWSKAGGILLLGFDTFKNLIHNTPRISAKTKDKIAPLDDQQHETLKKALLERPNLVVADEAHHFKSKSSSLNLAMNQIVTKSRIALTGSPLSNNLGEYHSLIDWIAPGYLGTYTEFKATYEEPISEGLYQDSTVSQYRESRKRLKALELEMEPKVHRADVSCLHAELKGKSEFVIRVALTELQRDLYRIYVENMQTLSSGKEPGPATLWSWLAVLRLLCNHPKCYKEQLFKVEPGSGSSAPALQKEKRRTSVAEEALIGSEDYAVISDEPVSRVAMCKTKDESRKVLESLSEPIDTLFLSYKTQALMNILNFSQDAHDKVLVFSHSIPTLNYVGEQLLKRQKEFIRIDGKVDPQKRQALTKVFNEGNTNICLISTRAGGQGLNFFGANRVVILDDHFNPMWELQAIGRAYRIGQQKPVFVYRLTVGGTFEQAIQNQALFKEHLATRVVDKKNPNRSALKGAAEYLFPPKSVDQEDLSQFLGKDPFVLDRLLAAQAENGILSITPSETFHVEDGFELTPAERKEAEQMQKEEQMRRRNPKAHTAMALARKEKDLRASQQHAPLHNPTPPAPVNPINSTQRVRWDAPMIATGEMLRLPSTAIDVTLGSESMLDAPLAMNQGEAMPINPAEPESVTLSSSTSEIGEGTSVPAFKQTQSSLDVPQRLSRTPKLSAHDLQNHIDKSVTGVANEQSVQQEEALGKAIRELLGKGSLNGSQTHKERVPKALQKTTRQEFELMIPGKSSKNRDKHIADSLGLSCARELRNCIAQKAKSEEEYRYLASELKHLLEKESVDPKTLLKVLRDISQPPKLDAPTDSVERGRVQLVDTGSEQPGPIHGLTETATGVTKHGLGHFETGSASPNGCNGDEKDKGELIRPRLKSVRPSNEKVNSVQENKGGQKRSASVDDERPKKKMKPATPNEKWCVDLLRREAARSSRGGSAA